MTLSAGVLAGCSPTDILSGGPPEVTATTGRPQEGGRLVYGIDADPNGLDPTRNAWDNVGILLANALYDPVAAFDADGAPQPYLAESLLPAPDFRSWTISIRPAVRFSDGDRLDAAAVVTFIDAVRRSPITGPATQMIVGVEAVDGLQVRVTLSRPWATMPALLAGQGGYIVSPKQLANPNGHSEPIGTGPFVLRHWEQDHVFKLVRNPGYWRAGLPLLDAVEFVVVPDGRSRIEMVQGGRADVTRSRRRGIWPISTRSRPAGRARCGWRRTPAMRRRRRSSSTRPGCRSMTSASVRRSPTRRTPTRWGKGAGGRPANRPRAPSARRRRSSRGRRIPVTTSRRRRPSSAMTSAIRG